MKYTYAYKTSDGQRHEAAMDAPSREVVFAELRKQGIKAIKVVAADGSKANGEVRGVRKRAVAALVALVALGVGVVAYRGGTRSVAFVAGHDGGRGTTALPFLSDTTRRQVIGDAAIIEKGIRTGWADVFPHEGDRFLASFAIPGVKAGVGTTSIAALEECLSEKVEKRGGQRNSSTLHSVPCTLHSAPCTLHSAPCTLHSAPCTLHSAPCTLHSAPCTLHSIEAQQILAMVEGMKREARAYLAAGGTLTEYGKRLTERQDAEIAIYKRVEAEILSAYNQLQHPARGTMPEAAFTRLYEQRNDELRNLGIRPITLPE